MSVRPWAAILLVVVGVAAIAAMLPLWPELLAVGGGFSSRGASLPDALRSDVPLLVHGRCFEALRAIDATQYVGMSVMGAIVLGSGWVCARYLREQADPLGDERD